MKICFYLSTAAERAVNDILVAQIIIQGATICTQLCMVNFHNMFSEVVEGGFTVNI